MDIGTPFPGLWLGGNVFGWTADRATSFGVLDAAFDAGITAIDTADVYSAWANAGVGGQSEEIIGSWMAERGRRGAALVATKVGMLSGLDDLRPGTVHRAADASLRRLGLDRIDLYYAHRDDGGDLAETFGAFDDLVRAGKVAEVGLSNFDAGRLREAMETCDRNGLRRPVALQPEYSLMERAYEDAERELARTWELAVMPYAGLAGGFLTGKYRPGGEVDSRRADRARAYLDDPRGTSVLEALDRVAGEQDAPATSVALAWLRCQPTVSGPIASARTVEQVGPLARSFELELTSAQLDDLEAASRPTRSAA